MTPLLSLAQAAAFLGVHENTLDRWSRIGQGPARVKLNGRVMYRPETLEKWVADNES